MEMKTPLNGELILAMSFQTDHTFAPNHRIVSGAFGQIQPVAREEGHVTFEFGQAEGD
jgi:hypothetical protein